MLAVEFETHAKNGMIQIPDKYRDIADGEVKIIILKQEQKSGFPGKHKYSGTKRLLKQIQNKHIFDGIDDPVEWQRTIRDEWS